MITQSIKDDFYKNYQTILSQIRSTEVSEFTDAVKAYSTLVRSYIETYQHHQGSFISDEDLRERFIHETAILHTVSLQFQSWIDCLSGQLVIIKWDINEPDNFYQWYTPEDRIVRNWKQSPLDDLNMITPELGVQLVDFCDFLLSQVGQRYLGEYYTPISLTRHLLDLVEFSPEALLNGARAVDPACGSGNILAEMLVRVLDHAQDSDLPMKAVLLEVCNNIHGYDIQPFAGTLTRTILQFITCLYTIADHSDCLGVISFKNIQLLDPLAAHNNMWSANKGKFKYIVGNPPFMSVKKEHIPHIDLYDDILSGHPNLYTMFLWWAVRSTTSDGLISFLLPQSILAGPYFTAIRTALGRETKINAVTRLLDRKGVVGEADQQMMVLALGMSNAETHPDTIALRVVRNGDSIAESTPVLLPYEYVISKVGDEILWHISDNVLDFEILATVQGQTIELGECSEFQIGNGSFVWNQHKELVHKTRVRNSIPLISSASISQFGFSFPYDGKHDARTRQFACVRGEKIQNKIHKGNVLLIKRTTPRKVGRRLIAGMPPSSFHTAYPEYFLENHVNYIRQIGTENEKLLYGLLGWLNSDVVNFVFQLRNGSTQVSVYELNLLPINIDLISELVPIVECLLSSQDETKKSQLEIELNQTIAHRLNFGAEHQCRMETVLKWREKSMKSKG